LPSAKLYRAKESRRISSCRPDAPAEPVDVAVSSIAAAVKIGIAREPEPLKIWRLET
jgi:hypothetical protein